MRTMVPEFQVMSLRPLVKGEPGGIGGKVVKRLQEGLQRFPMIDPLQVTQTRIEGKQYPLGRHLRSKLHELMEVSAERKQENLRALNTRKFCEVMEQGETAYQRARKARITAAQGRRIERIKTI